MYIYYVRLHIQYTTAVLYLDISEVSSCLAVIKELKVSRKVSANSESKKGIHTQRAGERVEVDCVAHREQERAGESRREWIT